MKRKEKKVLLIGEEFTEKKGIYTPYYREYREIDDCYSRASDTKKYIFNKYYRMLLENTDGVECYGIRSYNANIITLHAIVNKDNKKIYVYITPSYNWYEEIEEV